MCCNEEKHSFFLKFQGSCTIKRGVTGVCKGFAQLTTITICHSYGNFNAKKPGQKPHSKKAKETNFQVVGLSGQISARLSD